MNLTLEKKQQFSEWLNSVTTYTIKCNVCNGEDFGILDNVVFLRARGVSSYPNVGLICTTCQHIILFDATKSGVMDTDDNKTDFGITCQKCFDAEAEMQADDGEYLCSDCYNND